MSAPESLPALLSRAVEELREIAGLAAFSHIPCVSPRLAEPLADLLEAFTSCECDEDGDHWAQKSAALKVARAVLGEAEADVEAEEPGDDGEYELAAILARHPGATFPELARAVLADGRFGKLDGAR